MDDKQTQILVAEDSLEGILTAVARAYRSRYGHSYTKIEIENHIDTMELFSEYISIKADKKEAQRVYQAAYEKIGSEAVWMIESVALSCDSKRGDVIYRFLILGFTNGKKVLNYLTDPCVARIYEINRKMENEVLHWKEFLRFNVHEMDESRQYDREEENTLTLLSEDHRELLTAVIAPKNKVLSHIMPHFSDRYGNEYFIIYDETHDVAGIHEPKKHWLLINEFRKSNPDIVRLAGKVGDGELETQELWKIFYRATDIEERKNLNLQRNNLPKWFRKNMTEYNHTKEVSKE